MADLSTTILNIPGSTDATIVGIQPGVALRGFDTRFDAFGRPARLEGREKLNSDLGFLIKRVLLARGLLKITLSESDLGNIAKLLQDEIEDPQNWWVGQATPVSLSEVKITLRSESKVGGIEVTPLEGDGDLEIKVGYVERATGVVVAVDGADALIIPFGAFLRRSS
jgi:hypothetical protein